MRRLIWIFAGRTSLIISLLKDSVSVVDIAAVCFMSRDCVTFFVVCPSSSRWLDKSKYSENAKIPPRSYLGEDAVTKRKWKKKKNEEKINKNGPFSAIHRSHIPPAFANRQQALFSLIQYKVLPNACTKFQNPRSSSSWEIFDGKKVYTQTNTQSLLWKRKKNKLYSHYILQRPVGIINDVWTI